MKRILTILIFLLSSFFSFSQVPDTTGPFRGLEQWYSNWQIPYPSNSSSQTGNDFDEYYRFEWGQIENMSAASSQYSWAVFDQQIQHAMDNRRRFNFAVMPYYSSASTGLTVSGALLSYPSYLHNQMQAEATKDWISSSDGAWVQDWNSNSYLTAWENLQKAIANHIATTSYKPSWSSVSIPYTNVIGYVDIRGFGSFGEWQTYPWGQDAGYSTRVITYASVKRLIDANLTAFPNFWQDIGMQAMCPDPTNNAWGIQDAQSSYYAVTATTNKGKVAWRRDNWGGPQSYYNFILDSTQNTYSYNGVVFGKELANRWKYAPVCGEPYQCCTTDGSTSSDYYYDLVREVTQYRPAIIGNGNIENPSSSLTISRFQQAGSLMGYKLQISNDSVSKNSSPGGVMKIYSKWTNRGLTPNYEDWTIKYQLRNSSNSVVWEGVSTFVLKLFLPSTVSQVDSYTLPASVPTGTYSLYVKVLDPTAYRLPLVLRQGKQSSDTAYLLNSSVVVGTAVTPPPNQPPVAKVVSGVVVQLPSNSTVLDGSSSTDPDGTISSYIWSQVSGPNTATLSNQNTSKATISNLIAGTYIFNLIVTDNLGATGTTNDTVTVKSAIASNQPPVAAVVADTVQLPLTTGLLDGRSSKDPDGTVVKYNWLQTSGPVFGNIQYPDSSYTNVLNLTLAGNYTFSLTVTDNQGATSTATENVVVKSAVTGSPIGVSIYNLYGQLVAKKVVYSYSLTELEQGLHLRKGLYIAKYDTGIVIKFYFSH
jgi:Domain of unknown function (DUF4832)